jgi:hypothetical protein
MTCVQHEYESEDELEALSELEDESEWEDELEDESESEAFYSRLARLARRRPRSKALVRIAKRAAQAAISSLANAKCDGESECEAEAELEDEGEAEGEFEAGLNPIRRVYPDALMEHLGHAATETEDEAEAEAFIGALLPLAAKVLPKVGKAVMKAAPHLAKAAARVTRTLRKNPATRQLVRTMPELARRTVRSLAHRVAHGKPLTGRAAVRSLARHASHLLKHPQRVVHAYRRSRALHRSHHGAGPHYHPGVGHVHRRHGVAYPRHRHRWRARRQLAPGAYGPPGWKYWARLGARPAVAGGIGPATAGTAIPGTRRRLVSTTTTGPLGPVGRRRRTCNCCCCGCGR